MLIRILGAVMSRSAVRFILRGAGGAMLAGIGYRLGEDVYRALKRMVTEPPPTERAGEPRRAARENGRDRGPHRREDR